MRREEIEAAVKQFLIAIGENPDRSGLKETPARVARMCEEIFSGMEENPHEYIKMFDSSDEEMVIVKDIEFYSLCEHHLLPFFGTVTVGYIPNGSVIGLSKVARIVNCYARKLQIQEQMTSEIANCISTLTGAKGVAVYVKAKHMCMSMRGIKSRGAQTITSTFVGDFKDNIEKKSEFMTYIK